MKQAASRLLPRLRDWLGEGFHLLILLGGILPFAVGCWVLSLALRRHHRREHA